MQPNRATYLKAKLCSKPTCQSGTDYTQHDVSKNAHVAARDYFRQPPGNTPD